VLVFEAFNNLYVILRDALVANSLRETERILCNHGKDPAVLTMREATFLKAFTFIGE